LIRPKHGLGCWTVITRDHEGAREEIIPAPKLQDGANTGIAFTAAVEEKQPKLTAPAMGRRRHAKMTGSEKTLPSRRSHSR
jgi:hypothetical protein